MLDQADLQDSHDSGDLGSSQSIQDSPPAVGSQVDQYQATQVQDVSQGSETNRSWGDLGSSQSTSFHVGNQAGLFQDTTTKTQVLEELGPSESISSDAGNQAGLPQVTQFQDAHIDGDLCLSAHTGDLASHYKGTEVLDSQVLSDISQVPVETLAGSPKKLIKEDVPDSTSQAMSRLCLPVLLVLYCSSQTILTCVSSYRNTSKIYSGKVDAPPYPQFD